MIQAFAQDSVSLAQDSALRYSIRPMAGDSSRIHGTTAAKLDVSKLENCDTIGTSSPPIILPCISASCHLPFARLRTKDWMLVISSRHSGDRHINALSLRWLLTEQFDADRILACRCGLPYATIENRTLTVISWHNGAQHVNYLPTCQRER